MTRALVPMAPRPMLALARAAKGEMRAYVTAEEVHRARELARSPVRELLGVLWVTGARISEALAIRRCDLDTRLQIITLVTLKRKAATVRNNPIPGEYFAELLGLVVRQQQAAAGEGFEKGTLYHKRRPEIGPLRAARASGDGAARIFSWSRSRAFELVRGALLAAGVERGRARPHALRHGHAIHAINNGVPVNVIQRTLGHASVVTTSIYLAVTAEDVRKAYKGIDW